jgi:hypothetical protein
MSNDIALVEGMDLAAIMALTGQQTQEEGSSLTFLRANRTAEDEFKNSLTLGAFSLTSTDKQALVYAAEEIQNPYNPKRTMLVPKPVIFRPFINAYQYSIYDNELAATTNRSVIFTDFRQDALDEKGGNRCGKIIGKAKKGLTKDQETVQKKIKCHRLVFGLVSGFTGIDALGNEQTAPDTPVLYKQGGSSFMAFGEQVLDVLNKAKRPMFMHELSLVTERIEHTKDVIGYEPRYTLDLTKSVTVTASDVQLLKDFQEYIKKMNDKVMSKYNDAIKGVKSKDDDLSAKIIDDMDDTAAWID